MTDLNFEIYPLDKLTSKNTKNVELFITIKSNSQNTNSCLCSVPTDKSVGLTQDISQPRDYDEDLTALYLAHCHNIQLSKEYEANQKTNLINNFNDTNFKLTKKNEKKRNIIIVDVSWSMFGDNINLVRKTLTNFLHSKKTNEKIELFVLNDTVKCISDDMTKKDIDNIKIYGLTDLIECINIIFNDFIDSNIFLITDGTCVRTNLISEEILKKLVNIKKCKLFSFILSTNYVYSDITILEILSDSYNLITDKNNFENTFINTYLQSVCDSIANKVTVLIYTKNKNRNLFNKVTLYFENIGKHEEINKTISLRTDTNTSKLYTKYVFSYTNTYSYEKTHNIIEGTIPIILE